MTQVNKMVSYNTTLGMFVMVGDSATDNAMNAVRTKVGNEPWKAGFIDPKSDPSGATAVGRAELAAMGIPMAPGVAGRVARIMSGVTTHRGGASEKIRVILEKPNGTSVVLSQDLKGEFAHKLAQKLENIQPGQFVTIEGWGTTVEKQGRKYGNHNVSVKDAEGNEVPVVAGHFAKASQKATENISVLKTLGMCKTSKDEAKVKKEQVDAYHVELFKEIEKRFDAARQAASSRAPA